MTGWTHLANELLYAIFNFLPNSDLKSIRLTCKFLSVVTPVRLNRVFISPFKRDLDTLRSIASHPVFCSQVTEIIWDDRCLHLDDHRIISGTRYDDLSSNGITSFKKTLADVAEVTCLALWSGCLREYPYGENGDLSEWERLHHLLIRLYYEQQSTLESYEDVDTFRFALQAFPRLRRATIAGNCQTNSGQPHRYKTPLMRSLPPWLMERWPCRFTYFCGAYNPPLRGYYAAIRELSRSSSHSVSEFVVEPTHHGIDYAENFKLFSSPNEHLTSFIAKSSLTTLEYTLNPCSRKSSHGFWYWTTNAKEIFKMTLSATKTLEHFSLNTNLMPSRGYLDSQVSLLEILPVQHWRALRSFSLLGFILTLKDTVLLLSALPATVTSLKFHQTFFSDSSWENALACIGDRLRWSSNPDTMPTLTVSLRARHPFRTIVLCDDLTRFFEGRADNPFTVEDNTNDDYDGSFAWPCPRTRADGVRPGFGMINDEFDDWDDV
ncbi:hypothetical protein AJ79_09789 [Helicocarpus griseus UAMH5409]|uniref:F-box domain-containing protein n=1 Tax=Helicocarpus griseus UAMH5409 TaxID=1447875 RepID=A0A2B7WH97_9EURO|nr:hypothetical protein AJ79_09789 [Helicocarpus griseus UAMH5409]